MSIDELQKDILKFKKVILEIPIKHYYQEKYTRKVTQIFNKIFAADSSNKTPVIDGSDKCPHKLEPTTNKNIEDSYN
jgi:hypothetical protein